MCARVFRLLPALPLQPKCRVWLFGWLCVCVCMYVCLLPAWDAVKLNLPGGWLHLSFRSHRPYRFRSDDGNCSELAPGLIFDDFHLSPTQNPRLFALWY